LEFYRNSTGWRALHSAGAEQEVRTCEGWTRSLQTKVAIYPHRCGTREKTAAGQPISLVEANIVMIRGATVRPLTRASAVALLAALIPSPPARATVATDLCPSAQDPCEVNTALTVDPGSVIDLTGRGLQLDAAARITLGAGAVQILAGSVHLLPGARITGATGAAASSLEIDATGNIALDASGSTLSRIDLSAAPVAGGTITLKAAGAITVAGIIASNGPSTEASGGTIALTSAAGDLVVSGTLSSNGGSDGSGGFI